jgi:hypothetical protein
VNATQQRGAVPIRRKRQAFGAQLGEDERINRVRIPGACSDGVAGRAIG